VNLFAFALLLVIGVVFSFVGIHSMLKRWRTRSWICVHATINSVETKLIHDEGSYMADVVSYEYGSMHQLGTVQTSVNKHRVGQTLPLRYDPQEPSRHELSFRGEWVLYLIFEISGFVALLFAYQFWKGL
jgi:Protein of unknown function (DUF3592)